MAIRQLATKDIIGLANALAALDGHNRVVDHDGQQRVVQEFYSFAGRFRLSVAMNLLRCREVALAYQTARNLKIKELSGGKMTIDDPTLLSTFISHDTEMLESQHSIELASITEAALNLDQNAIPVTVLAGLAPLLVAVS